MTAGNLGMTYTKQQALNYTSTNYETSATYPNNYGTSSGNFDGSGLSWGCVQFNFGTGDLQPIWNNLLTNYPATVQAAITNTDDYQTFVNVVTTYTTAQQISWGDSISTPTNKQTLIAPWSGYLMTLGTSQPSIDYQNASVETNYHSLAQTWASDFGLWTRRGYSLCFDMAVQAGGMTTQCHADIMNFITNLPTNLSAELRELYVMRYFAIRRSADVTSSFQQSFQDRKLAIANGNGMVYGSNMDTVPYDLILEPNGLLALPPLKVPNFISI